MMRGSDLFIKYRIVRTLPGFPENHFQIPVFIAFEILEAKLLVCPLLECLECIRACNSVYLYAEEFLKFL